MADFSVRSDNVDVEQIMGQIRARIREKRGVDYTEEEIRELARVKLEKFLDPRGVRSDLLEQYRRKRTASSAPRNYAFEDSTLFESSRPILRFIRRMLRPILKLFFNPNPLIEALHIQSKLNDSYNETETLSYELIHNMVLETTRLGIEVKNLKMRLESMSSRLDFDERRARALEGVVQYRPGAVPPLQPPTGGGAERPLTEAEQAERRSRRRRRRGRRRPGDAREGAGAPAGGPAEGTEIRGGPAATGPRDNEWREEAGRKPPGDETPGSPAPTSGESSLESPASSFPAERSGPAAESWPAPSQPEAASGSGDGPGSPKPGSSPGTGNPDQS